MAKVAIGALLSSPRTSWGTDIKANKARHRREAIVAASAARDADMGIRPEENRALAAHLHDKAVRNAGLRVLQRKFRSAGRLADPNRPISAGEIRKIGGLRMAASNLGYQARALFGRGDTQAAQRVVARAKELRERADDAARRAVGISKEQELAKSRGSLTPEQKRYNAEKTMEHYRRKKDEGDVHAYSVVKGYERNRSLQSVISELDELVQRVSGSGYVGVITHKQFRAEHGQYKGGKSTSRTMLGRMRRSIMERKVGRRISTKRHGHYEAMKSFMEGRDRAAKDRQMKADEAAKMSALARQVKGIRRGSIRTKVGMGSRIGSIRRGSRGFGRVHTR